MGGRSWWRASKGCCCGGHGAQGSVSSGGAGGGTWNVVTLLQLVEVATDNPFFTAQLITSLWLLIFRQFKASSPEFGDADIWYCLYRTTARQRVRGGPSCSSQRSGATLSFGSKTWPQEGGGGSVAAAAAGAAAAHRLSFLEGSTFAHYEFAVFHGESEAWNEVFQRGFRGD